VNELRVCRIAVLGIQFTHRLKILCWAPSVNESDLIPELNCATNKMGNLQEVAEAAATFVACAVAIGEGFYLPQAAFFHFLIQC
jgi:hypothetical protein